ncbi:tetratricopeptide repeat protein [Maridesulfovibrio sp.]|uniref:tetratricopeptide repeat protein n=1 Tax=Maridesulfovibrio sp. TaxID=2795000 RepID=UPI0029CA99D5|nr:tetratricopeptide repeat protein [Maridesulfovibrio sp.]
MTVLLPVMHVTPLLAEEATVTPVEEKDNVIWTVRAGSFLNADTAWDTLYYLKGEGFKPVMVYLYDGQGRGWRVVQMGDYPTRSQARAAGRIFKKKTGLDYLVRSMSVELLEERTLESRKSPVPQMVTVLKPGEQPTKSGSLPLSGRELTGAPESLFYELGQRDVLLNTEQRLQNVLLARIMLRRGYVQEGLRLYAKLLRSYPGDNDLREEYVGALIDNNEIEKAESMLRRWIYLDPESPNALRLQARLRILAGDYSVQIDTLDYLLRLRPGDIDSISAKAYSNQQGGDWLGAINSFSALIDAEPDNYEARQALSSLLMERRPRLVLTPSINLQSDESVTTTLGSRFSMQLTDQTRGEFYYGNTRIYRPQQDGVEKINKDVNQAAFLFKREFTRTFTGIAGVGAFEGTASGISGALGFDWRIHDPGTFSAMIDYNNPWLDEPSAANYEGHYNQLSLTYDGFYDDEWGLFLNGQLRQYKLESDRNYGAKGIYNIILTRRILADPDLFISYSFYRSFFKYDDENYKPFEVVENESIHTLSASFSKSLCDTIIFQAAGGIRLDEFKEGPSYFGGPSLAFRLGRFELNLNYEYSSDSGLAGGGESQFLSGGVGFVF